MSDKTRLYVGTYTENILFGSGHILKSKGEGIYLLELDPQKGKLHHLETFKDIINPSYLALSQDGGFLYAVNELKEFEGKASGSVSAFKISKPDGRLSFINKQPTGGTDPCHVILNPDGTHLYVSNFMSGSVSVFPILEDGGIGTSVQFIQHAGSSVDPNRQSGPHAHALVFSPDSKFAFVPDLGLDKLMIYQTHSTGQPLTAAKVPFFQTKPGAGPRHCAFHPNGKFCYLINELDSTITALAYTDAAGSFEEIQSVSSLPEGAVAPGNTCADIHITPDGRFLYGSNRGHDSLIVYRIDPVTGELTFVDCQPCGGKTPRNFCIDPSGKFLICANQDSDDLVLFQIGGEDGRLTKTGRIEVPTPVCVKPVTQR